MDLSPCLKKIKELQINLNVLMWPFQRHPPSLPKVICMCCSCCISHTSVPLISLYFIYQEHRCVSLQNICNIIFKLHLMISLCSFQQFLNSILDLGWSSIWNRCYSCFFDCFLLIIVIIYINLYITIYPLLCLKMLRFSKSCF